jgi:hypothetical protein
MPTCHGTACRLVSADVTTEFSQTPTREPDAARWRRRDGRGLPCRNALVDRLVFDLALGRIRSVAFVISCDVSWTLPLYDVAIGTARLGWMIGIEDARYWLVTPEAVPLASFEPAVSAAARQRLEPEGITFIGSTYAEVRQGVVLLDPQDERIEVDRIVRLSTRWDCSFAA